MTLIINNKRTLYLCATVILSLFFLYSPVKAEENFGIIPLFGLEWGDNIDIIMKKSTVKLRVATNEDKEFIENRLRYLEMNTVSFVTDVCIYDNNFKTYIFTQKGTKMLSLICLFKVSSSFDELEKIKSILSAKYGEPKSESGSEPCFIGIRKYTKHRWSKKRSSIEASFSTCSGNNELLILYMGFL